MAARFEFLNGSGIRSISLSVFFALFFSSSAIAANPQRQLLVKLKPGATAADAERVSRNSLRSAEPAGKLSRQSATVRTQTGLQLLTLQEGVSSSGEIARLEHLSAVEYVEPNYSIKIAQATPAVLPDDFEFAKQYALRNPGSDGAKENADISAVKAWALTTGSKNVVVAVIDTGIDYFHEDLRDNLWRNRQEIADNGIDDDGNGYVDDVIGYDFVSYDSDPFDDNEHGTHVSGIVGAKGNNGIGTAGVCWEASIMAVKAFDQDGNGNVADAIAAIRYAVANGAKVINASWGLGERSRALEDATQAAADAGVLIVAAAGNERTDAPSYPASFSSVLSVAATDSRDTRAIFSNFGPTVGLAAPGADVYSTLPENRYGFASGTSMAAPQVTGVAALVLSRFPNYSRQELRDILVNSVDPMAFDQPVGSGRLNAYLAVRMDQPLPMAKLSVPSTISGRVSISGIAVGRYFSGYTLRAGAGTFPLDWIDLGSATKQITNGVIGEFDSSLIPDGVGTVQLIVTNQNGLTATATATIRLLNGLITSPLAGDVLAPGIFPIRGTVFGAGKKYELLYGAGLEPTRWVTFSSGVSQQSTNVLLGQWDATDLPAGFYSLKLLVESSGEQRFQFTAPAIVLDRDLRPGWPVYLPADQDFAPSDWRNVRVADLDGDGRSELVLVDPSSRVRPQKLIVFSDTGQVLWTHTLGFDIPPDLPVIGDIDGDGKSEIFVDSTNGIIAFKYDGTLLTSGWPIQTSHGNHAKVLADLDQDGKLELIAYSQEYSATQVEETRELAVYNHEGKLIRKWEMAWCGFTNAVQKIFPAVANIDDDPQLEIVVPAGCQELSAYDYRRADPKWRAQTLAPILSSPVIGDIDGRNGVDVVVATATVNGAEQAGVYVFTGKGQRWLGWPVLEEYSFTTPPALGDLDQDGRLEIILSSEHPAALHVLQWDGFEAEGWPKDIFSSTWNNTVSAADVDGDSRADVILTAPGYMNVAVSQNDISYAGGISAYSFSGSALPLSHILGVNAKIVESTTGRWHRAGPAIVCDLDGDGRLDLVSASVLDRTFGSFVRLKNRSSVYAWKLPQPYHPEAAAWPMFGHDARNSGAYSLPIIPIPPPTNATVAIRDRVITVEDRSVEIQPLANDWNASTAPLQLLTFAQPTNGMVTLVNSDTLRYSPNTNYAGFDNFSYQIKDIQGRTSTGSVRLRIKPLNDRPMAKEISLTMTKNTTIDVFFAATDAENDPLTYRILSGPKNGEVWNYPTLGSYYPKKGFHGFDFFTYVASDGKLEGDPATVQISVVNSNNPPRAFEMDLLTKTNRAVRINPQALDSDGDPLTFEIVRKPINGTAVPQGEGFLFTPDRDYVGSESFTFRAFDGTAFSEASLIRIQVIATNAAPRGFDGTTMVQPNSTNRVRLGGSDPDGDTIQFVVLSPPLHGKVEGTPPDLSYIPDKDFTGPDRLTFKVSDSFAESALATFNFRVERQNRPPESKDQSTNLVQDTTAIIALEGLDPDGDQVKTIILRGPKNGLVYNTPSGVVYSPKRGFIGSDQFTYKLWDGQKFGNIARVSVSVLSSHPDVPFRFKSISVESTAAELRIEPGLQSQYRIEVSTNLFDWTRLAGPFPATLQVQTFRDTNVSSAPRFYRAVNN